MAERDSDVGKRMTMRPTRIPLPGEAIGERATIRPKGEAQAKKQGRFAKGDVILGRYEVLAELGQGGMGVVYKCFDRTGGIEVAVKGLPPEVSHDASSMEDIRDNFQLVSDLRHPGIVGIKNLEADSATGDYYLVMDLASGKNLHRWAKAHQGPESMAAKLKIVEEIAAALDYAHGRRVMHRDVKPENVMIDTDGHAHVLDFGLASQIRTSLSRRSLVMRSQSGTPTYKAPEQWRGQPQNAATDQYALGVLAYELVAGYLPFDSDDPAILRMSVLSEPVAAIPEASAGVNSALARALAKNPAERFANCSDFARALSSGTSQAAGAVPLKMSAGGKATGGGGSAGGSGGMWAAAIVAVACLAVLAAVVVQRVGGSRQHPVDRPPGDVVDVPVQKDPVELALEAFRRDDYKSGYAYAMSTDRTHPKLQCYIGMCYDQKEPRSRNMNIAKDDWTAKTWYEKSARQGDTRAMTYMGVFCENGRGGAKDLKQAVEWFKKAADAGYPEGEANLQRITKRIEDEVARKRAEAERARQRELAEKERIRREKEAAERAAREAEAARVEKETEERNLEGLRNRGYVIENGSNGRKAVWREGNSLPQYPHWVTTAKENTWRIEDGYAKIDSNGGPLSPVAWKPGWQKTANVKAGDVEGSWLRRTVCPGCQGRRQTVTTESCQTCKGYGKVKSSRTCSSCNGSRFVHKAYVCQACGGNRQVRSSCSTCGGSGKGVCANCGGNGRVVNPGAVVGDLVNIFGARRGRRVPTGPQYMTCPSCRGAGRATCSGCGGNGVVLSSCQTCGGSGQVGRREECQTCGGSGQTSSIVACGNCHGGKVQRSQTCTRCSGEGVVWTEH